MSTAIAAPEEENAYDELSYPSLVFPHFRPERMAVAAHLHGLTPPRVETARLLNVGGGDGLDAMAFAAAFPQAQAVNFDLAAQPIARGERWARAAGMANVRHLQLDLTRAAEELDGTFDFIHVHGVYAWVPDFVREAIMPLIAAKLSPDGIAMVSFNALPGCSVRLAIRELLQLELAGLTGLAARAERATEILHKLAEPRGDDTEPLKALRFEASRMGRRGIGELGHDELGESYAPQRVDAVFADARAAELRALGDIGYGHMRVSFLPGDATEADPQAAYERRSLIDDLAEFNAFHHLLLIHDDDRPLPRRFDPARLRELHASTVVAREGPTRFAGEHQSVELEDPALGAFLDTLIAAAPGHVPIADQPLDDERIGVLLTLWNSDVIDLHLGPDGPYAVRPSARPAIHPLLRVTFESGADRPFMLDSRRAAPLAADTIRLLCLLDGTRDLAALDAAVRAMGAPDGSMLPGWLTAMARRRLLVR